MKRIRVVTLTGKNISVDVEDEDTIEIVKYKIWNESNIPPKDQRLIFAGKNLEDEKRISNYNIQNGNTLTMVTLFRGNGMQNVKVLPDIGGDDGWARAILAFIERSCRTSFSRLNVKNVDQI